MDAVVSFDNVSFGYNDDLVLQNVTFSVNQGEFVGIIGPNGGGKTTLLRLILGFLQPQRGTVQIFGKNSRHIQECIAYVPQKLDFDTLFPISVLELVLMGRLSHLPWHGRYQRADRDAAMASLDTVGLVDLSARQFGSLSSGQAQRVLIARALVSKPKLLLLDEPTASVDIQSETNIRHILQQLRNEITIIMVTHNIRTIIDDVQKVLCVEGNVTPLRSEEICEHFAYGLYHPPLIKRETEKNG